LEGDESLGRISPSYEEFLKGCYSALSGRYYRPIDAPPEVKTDGTHTNVNESIDVSVFDRWRRKPEYQKTPNLKAWAEKHAVDPAMLTSSVSAADPSITVTD
jgi:hypothetical protein